LDNLLLDIPSATDVLPDKFTEFQRVFYTCGLVYQILFLLPDPFCLAPYHVDVPSPPLPVIMRKNITWSDLLDYFRTFSALHSYHERFPEDSKRSDGDLASRFLRGLIEGAEIEDGKKIDDNSDIQIEWPLALILARRK
jgi:trans-aconitate 3-methyltransferase